VIHIEASPQFLPVGGAGPMAHVAGTHTLEYRLRAYPAGDGFTLEESLLIDHQWHSISLVTRTAEQLADLFERAHHAHHGRPPQGLDPREGPTRLHPGPGR